MKYSNHDGPFVFCRSSSSPYFLAISLFRAICSFTRWSLLKSSDEFENSVK